MPRPASRENGPKLKKPLPVESPFLLLLLIIERSCSRSCLGGFVETSISPNARIDISSPSPVDGFVGTRGLSTKGPPGTSNQQVSTTCLLTVWEHPRKHAPNQAESSSSRAWTFLRREASVSSSLFTLAIEWRTVLWSRPPKRLPISTRDSSVSSRER